MTALVAFLSAVRSFVSGIGMLPGLIVYLVIGWLLRRRYMGVFVVILCPPVTVASPLLLIGWEPFMVGAVIAAVLWAIFADRLMPISGKSSGNVWSVREGVAGSVLRVFPDDVRR